MRSHIESTIPSDVAARPARDLRQAVRQQPTRDWWDFKHENHERFTSQVVLDEIASGEAGMGPELLGLLHGVHLLEPSTAANDLAREILRSGRLPAAARAILPTSHWLPLMKWIFSDVELPPHCQCRHSTTAAAID